VLREGSAAAGPWTLLQLTTHTASNAPAEASVHLRHADGRLVKQSAQGDGPVDAAFKAMETATGLTVNVHKFELRSVSEGEDAQGEAIVSASYGKRSFRGSSISTNIVESSARAFLEVINRIETTKARLPDENLGAVRAAQAAV